MMFRILIATTTSFVAGFLHGRAERRLEDAEQCREQFLQQRRWDDERVNSRISDRQLDLDKAKERRIEWLIKYGKLSQEEALECFSDT